MADSNFSIDQVSQEFGVKVRKGAVVAKSESVVPPTWLREILAKYHDLAFVSEKSRSEFIIAPILVACRELMHNEVYIYSGITLDVDPAKGLNGACDFLFSCTAPTPVLEAPLLVVVEAKKDDLYLGLGQCAAEMLAARIFNERRQKTLPCIFGCVTTGRDWQFLKLEQDELFIHHEDFFIKDLEQILGILVKILKQGVDQARSAAA